ncbi:MAG: hypothetical protein QXK45_06775 [Thermofilaceae archaeon]
MAVVRVDRLKWYVDGYYVEWRGGVDGGFACGCGRGQCGHVKKLWRWLKARGQVVYVLKVRGAVRPRAPALEVEGGYVLYSTRPVIEYVEFTPQGPAIRVARGRPVPLAALAASVPIS